MNTNEYVEVDPKKMMGKPVIKGTRITVELILEKLSCGETFDDILVAYPSLDKNKILAALSFAAESLRGEKIYPLAI